LRVCLMPRQSGNAIGPLRMAKNSEALKYTRCPGLPPNSAQAAAAANVMVNWVSCACGPNARILSINLARRCRYLHQ
jgi:hypothetical protein